MTTHSADRQNLVTSRITAVEIGNIALRLCEISVMAQSKHSNFINPVLAFKEHFAFVFDLLVNAEWQLDNLPAKRNALQRKDNN